MRRGEGQGLAFIHWVTAVLHNGLGRYQEALAAAAAGRRGHTRVLVSRLGVVELIEAAARSGKAELVADALAPTVAR